jgi:hypothetical protein
MEGQYLNIPFGILFNPKLTSDEKLILAEIVSLDKLMNGCTAGDNHFAKIINKTRQTTNGIIKKLETMGLLEIKVKPGIGKKTKPVKNFWELIAIPVGKDDTSVEQPIHVGVGDSDTTCRDSLQVGVEIHDTTCRDSDTTITITNTDILIQEELHNTGATDNISVEINDCWNKDACSKLNELINTDPATISNPFRMKFQDCCAGLDLFFGSSFFDNCHIFKSNKELYEIYGSSNFFEVRMDLIFVRENMNRFLRQGI